MITFIEREKAFRAELQTLLQKYNTDLEAKDHYEGYTECGEDIRMTVWLDAVYDEQHSCIVEGGEIDLGSFVSKES